MDEYFRESSQIPWKFEREIFENKLLHKRFTWITLKALEIRQHLNKDTIPDK
jgi:hypothetical protein